MAIDSLPGEVTASNLIDHTGELGDIGNVSWFGIDADGELYVASYSLDSVLKILAPPIALPAPARLRIIR